MRRFFNFLFGAIIGGIIGALIGLLLAPYSGNQLRLTIQEQAGRIQGEISQAASDKRIELNQQLEKLRAPKPKAEG